MKKIIKANIFFLFFLSVLKLENCFGYVNFQWRDKKYETIFKKCVCVFQRWTKVLWVWDMRVG